MSLLKWGGVFIVIIATFISLKSKFKTQLPIVVDGYYHPAFKPLADAFRKQVESGKEKGGSFAIYQNGELVFDMWGGYADMESKRPWKRDTMTTTFSVSKGIVAIVIASLVDKGYLDYKRPVADYWPEFGQNDKGNITVEILLSHRYFDYMSAMDHNGNTLWENKKLLTAGLPLLDTPIHMRDILDNPTKVQNILASQRTVWPAGSLSGYHVLTYGLYADVLVQKVDPKGRSSTQVFLEDIATPFEIDAFMNCPLEQFHRVAKVYSPSPWKQLFQSLLSPKYFGIFGYMLLNPGSYMSKASQSVIDFHDDINHVNNPDIREVTMTSTSVTGTARSLAKVYGILANDGKLGDRELLSDKTRGLLAERLVNGLCEVTRIPNMTVGYGMFFLQNPKGQWLFGHPGHGGQMAFADVENNVGFAYLTNHLSIYGTGDDPRFIDLQDIMYECIDNYKKLKRI